MHVCLCVRVCVICVGVLCVCLCMYARCVDLLCTYDPVSVFICDYLWENNCSEDCCRHVHYTTHAQRGDRGDRGWLSHGLVVTLPISYSLDVSTLWGFTRDMRIAD